MEFQPNRLVEWFWLSGDEIKLLPGEIAAENIQYEIPVYFGLWRNKDERVYFVTYETEPIVRGKIDRFLKARDYRLIEHRWDGSLWQRISDNHRVHLRYHTFPKEVDPDRGYVAIHMEY